MAITKNAMLTKGQRRRLAAFRRRQATRRMRSQTRVKLPPLKLSKTAKTRLKYAAGPELAKVFTKKPAVGQTRRVRMVNNAMGGTAITVGRTGTRSSSRVAGAAPQYAGLVNMPRYIAPPSKVTQANLNNLIGRMGSKWF